MHIERNTVKKAKLFGLKFDLNSANVEFFQVRIVVDKDSVIMDEEETENVEGEDKESLQFRAPHSY
jgi:hypothetical protein